MSPEPEQQDQQILALFGELRRNDERHVPSFHRDWHAAMQLRQQERNRILPRVLAAAAAAILLVAVGAGLLTRAANDRVNSEQTAIQIMPAPAAVPAPTATRPQEPQPAATIEDWESPTAVLLDLSSNELSPEEGDLRNF